MRFTLTEEEKFLNSCLSLPVLHSLQRPPSQMGVEKVAIHLYVRYGAPIHL